MHIVVDANIIFAAIIVESTTAELLCKKNLELYAPLYFFEELHTHTEELAIKTRRDDPSEFLSRLKKRMRFVEPEKEFMEKAVATDDKDIAYVALAMQLGCPVWSNDKRLKMCGVQVITTKELLNQLR